MAERGNSVLFGLACRHYKETKYCLGKKESYFISGAQIHFKASFVFKPGYIWVISALNCFNLSGFVLL